MTLHPLESRRELMRRVDEVRGLSGGPEHGPALDPDDPSALLGVLAELAEELERSRRRLIETNVQLVSLREVASRMLGDLEAGETTRIVTRYLCHAFGFEHAFLLLVDRDRQRLEGTWTRGDGGREDSVDLEVSLLADRGAIGRAFWLNRTVVHHEGRHHPPAELQDGHPLALAFDGLGAVVCVPLQRSQALTGDAFELCGSGCIVGDASLLAPPAGTTASEWTAAREQRQARCLSCELNPMLGVIGIARGPDAPPLSAGDVSQLESVALSLAPVVENARLNQALRTSQRFQEHVLDSMASALVAVNMKGEILTFNRVASELTGFDEADAVGRPFGERLGEAGERVVLATLEHGREVMREETLLRARDGEVVPVSLTTSLLRNEKRGVYGAIATFVDLRPLKRAEEHARRQDRLAALGRFTSSVAHEIRNPLTGIGAGVQYLTRGLADSDPQRENLDFIQREIRRLDRIVQDLFDITHPRGLQLRVAPLEDTVARAVQCVDALARERAVTVTFEAASRVPPVTHDADQIEQVLINLVKNAIEASPAGAAVAVSVQATPPTRRGALPAGVRVRVEDHGDGIDAETQKTIFEPFFTTKPGGTGLGLYITHDIVKRHGGSLAVQSEPGRGTRFTVDLPLEAHGGNP